MKSRFLNLVAGFLMVLSILATGNFAYAQISINAYTEPETTVQFGQTVRLYIEIERPAELKVSYQFSDIKIKNAVVLQPEQLGTSYSRTKNKKSIVGYRQKFVIIPKQAGILEIPPITVTLKSENPHRLTTDKMTLNVSVPANVTNIDRLIVASAIQIDQQIKPLEAEYKVGDVITRSITINALDTFALTLPPMLPSNIKGLAQHTGIPVLKNSVNRGEYKALRIDETVYTIEKKGDFKLPALQYEFWNTQTNSKSIVTVPEVSFSSVLTAQNDVSSPNGYSARALYATLTNAINQSLAWIKQNWLASIAVALGLIAIFLFAKLAFCRVEKWMRIVALTIRQSEWVIFRQLLRAAKKTQGKQFNLLFWGWIEKCLHEETNHTLSSLQKWIDQDGILFLHNVFVARYSQNSKTTLTTAQITAGLKRLRKQIQQNQKITKKAGAFHSLNPRLG